MVTYLILKGISFRTNIEVIEPYGCDIDYKYSDFRIYLT